MIFLGFDNKAHKFNTTQTTIRSNCSNLHIRARAIIKEVYPFESIFEEIPIPGSRTTRRKTFLYADFFLPTRKVMIEANGRQHYEYIKFFHNSKMDFYMSKARDREKTEWCILNNFTLIELPYNESDTQWADRLNNLVDGGST